MNDFAVYMHAKTKTKAARNEYSYASMALENAMIFERLAEIKSQHEPLASLIAKQLSERERLYAAAHYVVIGRMPEEDHTPEGRKG